MGDGNVAKPTKWPLTKVLEVTWFDANAKSGWGSREEYNQHDIAPVVSIGYLLRESKRSITLVSSQGVDWDDVNGAIAIPKSWIAKQKILRK